MGVVGTVGAVGTVAAAALTGCTATETGVPQADPVALRAPAGPAPPQPRIRDFPLQNVDPCQLLTGPQLDELHENGVPERVTDQRDGPACAFRVDAAPPHYAYYLETITDADLQDWLTGRHAKSSMTKEPVDIPGFPAMLNYRASTTPQDCETLVGVAWGQTLRVQLAPVTQGAFDQRRLCEMSTQAATMALETLRARK